MEVIATIRFIRPCLGNIRQDPSRKENHDRMQRDPASGKVIFQQTWWRAGLGYAAQALCKHQKDVNQIQADPLIEGDTAIIKRYWSDREGVEHSTDHEGFDQGVCVQAKFCLPHRITLEGFRELLTFAGRYVGISPYGYREDWGRFTVDTVIPAGSVHRAKGNNSSPGKPDTNHSGLPPSSVSGPAVHKA